MGIGKTARELTVSTGTHARTDSITAL